MYCNLTNTLNILKCYAVHDPDPGFTTKHWQMNFLSSNLLTMFRFLILVIWSILSTWILIQDNFLNVDKARSGFT